MRFSGPLDSSRVSATATERYFVCYFDCMFAAHEPPRSDFDFSCYFRSVTRDCISAVTTRCTPNRDPTPRPPRRCHHRRCRCFAVFHQNDAPIASHLFSLPKHSLARAAQTPPTPIPHPPTQRRCFEPVSGVVHSLCEEATLPFFTPYDAPFASRLFAIPTTSRAHLAPAVHESPSKAFRSHPSNPFAGYRKHCVVSSTQLLPAKQLHMHKKVKSYDRPRIIKSSAVLPRFHQRFRWKHLLPLPTVGRVLLSLPRAAG